MEDPFVIPTVVVAMNDSMAKELVEWMTKMEKLTGELPPAIFALKRKIESDLRAA